MHTPAAPHPQTYKRCRLRRFKAGEQVLTAKQARRTLALVIEGLATYEVEVPAALRDGREVPSSTSQGLLYSGTCFDKGGSQQLGRGGMRAAPVARQVCAGKGRKADGGCGAAQHAGPALGTWGTVLYSCCAWASLFVDADKLLHPALCTGLLNVFG